VVGRKNFDLIDELLAPDFVEHQEFPGLSPTREGVKQFFQLWTQAFPDTKLDGGLLMQQLGVVPEPAGTTAG
jgi:hypothetical protein